MPQEQIKYVDCIMAKKIKKSLKRSRRAGIAISSRKVVSNREGAFAFVKKYSQKVLNIIGDFKLSLGLVFRVVFASKLGLILMILTVAVPLTAFEAHVVNVTATIERRPCDVFEIRSLGYWKTHSENWILPQNLGNDLVMTNADADAVFNAPNNVMRNKLKKQLLALKFDIAFFEAGNGLVPGDPSMTLAQLMAEADSALAENPSNPITLSFYHSYIEEIIGVYEQVSTCVTCPLGLEMIESYSFIVNSSTTVGDLRGNVNAGDHVRVDFRLAEGCEDTQLSLVTYEAPSDVFDPETAGQQTVFDSQSGVFNSGESYMEVDVPACFFQIDFVKGPIITTLGPAGSDNFYSAQGRLISADNGDPEAAECQNLNIVAGLSLPMVSTQMEPENENEEGGDKKDLSLEELGGSLLETLNTLVVGGEEEVLDSTSTEDLMEDAEGEQGTDNATSSEGLVVEEGDQDEPVLIEENVVEEQVLDESAVEEDANTVEEIPADPTEEPGEQPVEEPAT